MRNAWDGPTILQVRRGERGGARSLLPRALRHALFSLPRFALSAAHQRTPPSPYTSHPRKHQSFLTIVEVIMVCAFGAVLAHVVSLRRKTECVCPQPELSGSMALRLSRALPPASPSQLAVPCSGSEGEILRLSPGCVKRIGGREVGGACVRRGGKLPFSQARTVQGGHANSAKKLRPRRVPTARLLPLRMRGG